VNNNLDAILNKAAQIEEIVKNFAGMAGGKTLRFIDGNFATQGWQGASFKPWVVRKKETNKSKGKNILSAVGTLRRGFNYGEVAPGEVRVYNNVKYANINNTGGTIQHAARSETFSRNRFVKGNKKGAFKKGVKRQTQGFTFKEHATHIPQRQFAPITPTDSPVLIDSISREVIKQVIELK
jgi:phage gpG-like protein